MTNLFYTFVLRFSQAGMDASLTLVAGVIIAGIIRHMVGPVATRRVFGSGTTGALRGWAAGMLLPVCSLGVIPVARELRRSGVPGGAVLAFVLTGPLLNPISFLYGLTLGEPKVILTFAGLTLFKTAVVAYMWDHWFGGAADAAKAIERARIADVQPLPSAGPRRILAVLVSAAKELSSTDVFYYVLGLLGNAFLSCAIPNGALRHSLFHHDQWAPLRMLFLCIPAYLSPLSGMMRIGTMFEHGNSIGAAFILLVLGIGMCLGTLLWLIHDFGRKIIPWFVLYAAIVLGVAYALEPLLWDVRKVEADHTHAFDDLSSPFDPTRAMSPAQMKQLVLGKLSNQFDLSTEAALICLAGMFGGGLVLRLVDPSRRLDRWLVATPGPSRRVGWDPHLSGVVVGGAALAGLIGFSVIGAYIYFPKRAFCLERMRYLSADTRDLVRQRLGEESIRSLEQWDLVARQLQVGVYIRDFAVTPEQAKTVDDLREAIEVVRDDLRAKKLEQAKQKLDQIVLNGEYRACVRAYSSQPTHPRVG